MTVKYFLRPNKKLDSISEYQKGLKTKNQKRMRKKNLNITEYEDYIILELLICWKAPGRKLKEVLILFLASHTAEKLILSSRISSQIASAESRSFSKFECVELKNQGVLVG